MPLVEGAEPQASTVLSDFKAAPKTPPGGYGDDLGQSGRNIGGAVRPPGDDGAICLQWHAVIIPGGQPAGWPAGHFSLRGNSWPAVPTLSDCPPSDAFKSVLHLCFLCYLLFNFPLAAAAEQHLRDEALPSFDKFLFLRFRAATAEPYFVRMAGLKSNRNGIQRPAPARLAYLGLPYPDEHRRQDWRSSGPRRLLPQLETNVPRIRTSRKRMAFVIDEAFFFSLV